MTDRGHESPAPTDAVVHSARLADDGVLTDDAWVAWADGRVSETGTGDSWRSLLPRDVVDARAVAGPGAVLSAGFVDLHGHGGGGAAYDDGIDAIRRARAAHRPHGTTSAVVALVADLAASDPDVLGSHLEGPFLSPTRAGAHDASTLLPPDRGVMAALLAAGRGTVRQVTVAPELAGALDVVEAVVGAGAAAAVGHTEADAATARRAFDAGATILTHAFNAMPGLHHREPGPIGAAIADVRVTVELIADGVHVHPDVLRMLLAAAPARVALVTDAMAAAAASDGPFRLGALDVDVRRAVARVAGTDVLAGSTLMQDSAVGRAVAAGLPLADALRAASAVPAAAIGLAHELGSLRPRLRADAVLLDASLAVRAVWASGSRVV